MNTKSTLSRFNRIRNDKRKRKETGKRSGSVRFAAFFLAVVVAISALSSNVPSVVGLFSVKASSALESEKYYNATVSLFDYYNDNDSHEQSVNRGQLFHLFNTCLYRKQYPGISRSVISKL